MPKGWIGRPSPKSKRIGTGWFGELDRVYVDEKQEYCVMVRSVETEWGKVDHACIRNVPNSDIPWAEKQRIKNEIFGQERTAVEVFPTTADLVDEANMYHIWVLPDGMKLPFGLKNI
jgi:hypothetical protein